LNKYLSIHTELAWTELLSRF